NLSGEDWKGVTLSLVAGAPLAFQATLEKPVVPPRPVVTDQGEGIGSMPTGETSPAGGPPPPPPPAAAPAAGREPPRAGAGATHTLEGLLEQPDSDHDGIADEEDRRAPSKTARFKPKDKAEKSAEKSGKLANAGPLGGGGGKKGGGGARFASTAPMS